MTVHCRIMKIDIEKFSADLTCRTSDLMDKNNEWKLPKDTYYDFDSEAADHKQEEDLKRKQQRTSEPLILFSLLMLTFSGCFRRITTIRHVAVMSSSSWKPKHSALFPSVHQESNCSPIIPQH